MKRLFSLLFLTVMGIHLFAATRYVNNNSGNDLNDGSLSFPWKTISKGILSSVSGDILDLTGTFLLTEDAGVTANGLEITKNLTLQGQGADKTFIKGAAAPNSATKRIFYITPVVVEIRNLSIENGVDDNGGGIYNKGYITLENVNVFNNTATNDGGGIYFGGTFDNLEGQLILDKVNIFGNSSTNGGGIYVSWISENSENFVARNTTINNNHAANSGGGFYFSNTEGVCNFENSTISSNSAVVSGGGIYFFARADGISWLNINSCTIADNTAGTYGKCIYMNGQFIDAGHEYLYGFAEVYIDNSIISGQPNVGYEGSQTHVNVTYSICSDNSIPGYYSSNYLTSTDPLLGSLSDNGGGTLTHALMAGSPALDKLAGPGYNGAPVLDQRGCAIYNNLKDIGSYEYYASIETPYDITSYVADGRFVLNWYPVAGATEYIIYSSDDPYGTFAVDTSGVFTQAGNEWSTEIASMKKFYKITAVN